MTARNGPLINFVPQSGVDLAELIQGRASNPVVRFSVAGSGITSYFRPGYKWEFEVANTSAIAPVEKGLTASQ